MSTLYPYVCECGVRFHSLPMPNIHCRSCGSMNIKTAAQAERDTTNPLHAALVQTVEALSRHAKALELLAYTSAGKDNDLMKWGAMQAGDMNKAITAAEAVLKGDGA